MKKHNEKYFTIAVYALGVILFSLVLLLLCMNFGLVTDMTRSFLSGISSLLYGILIALFLLPAVKRFDSLFTRWFCRKKQHPYLVTGLSIGTTFFIAFLLLAALFGGIIPHLVEDMTSLYGKIGEARSAFEKFIGSLTAKHPFLQGIYDAISNMLNPVVEDPTAGGEITAPGQEGKPLFDVLLDWAKNKLMPALGGVVKTTFDQVSNVFLGLIISIYLLASRRVISAVTGKLVYAIIPEKRVVPVVLFFKRLYTDFASYSFNRFISAILFASATLLVCIVMRVPYLSFIVLLVLIGHLFPVVGTLLSDVIAVIAVFIAFTNRPLILGFIFLGFVIGFEIFINQVIMPHMLPKKLRPSYAVTAFCVLLGFVLLGPFGAFIAVPVYATLNIEIRSMLVHRLKKKNLPISTAAYETFTSADYAAAQEAARAAARDEAEDENDE